MLGFHSVEEAEAAYRAAYTDGADNPTQKRDRLGDIKEMTLDELKEWAYKARESTVHVSFPVKAEKDLRRDEAGQPILRVLASGTKLDATSGIDDEGRDVIGEKVAPLLLQKMVEQAKTGEIYFIESHETTLPLGWVIDAEIVDLPDGNQELYADIRLDMENPMVPYLVKKFETKKYVPDCSVGLKVVKGTVWDADEGGFVGYLVDGYWEHIALTKPGHPAYPDAKLEDVFLEEQNFVSATKAIVASVRKDIAKESAHEQPAENREGEDAMQGLKIRGAVPVGTKAANKEGDIHIHPPAAPVAAAPVPEKVAESEAEAEARKAKEAEMEAEAEAAKKKEAAFPPASPAVPAAPEKPVPPQPKGIADGLKNLHEHLSAMKAMDLAGTSPEERSQLVAEFIDDIEDACEQVEELMGGAEEGAEAEESKDAKKEEGVAMEAAKIKEAEDEAKKAKDAEDACKAKEAEDAKKAFPPAAPAKPAGELVTKSREQRREARQLRREIRELTSTVKEVVESNKELKGKLEHLESQPAPRGPVRYADPNAFRDRIGAGKPEELMTALKAIPGGQLRDLASRAIAQDMVEKAMARAYPGMPGAPKA